MNFNFLKKASAHCIWSIAINRTQIMGQACFSMDQINLRNLGRGSLNDHLFQIGPVVYLTIRFLMFSL